MKLNEAKIKKKRHKSLDPWRLYVPDWSRTSGLLLRRSVVCRHAVPSQCYLIPVFTGFSLITDVIMYLCIIADFI